MDLFAERYLNTGVLARMQINHSSLPARRAAALHTASCVWTRTRNTRGTLGWRNVARRLDP